MLNVKIVDIAKESAKLNIMFKIITLISVMCFVCDIT